MSEHVVSFIPADPEFVPAAAAQAAAITFMQQAWQLTLAEVCAETDDGITFRDCGEHFASVHCPHCHRALALEQWQGLMDSDFSETSGFRLSLISMSCCGQPSTLNQLHYQWPMGFSRFVLRCGDRAGEVGADVLAQLESLLGCSLRVIRAMY